MKLTIWCVGQKMPQWVQQGCQTYLKRFTSELRVDLREIAPARRVKSQTAERYREEEGARILSAIPDHALAVVLDVEGEVWSTETLAEKLLLWQEMSHHPHLIVGGPDGVSDAVLKRSQVRWSLSPLTFPHPLVRVILLEQLYRAASINKGHPYHRSE